MTLIVLETSKVKLRLIFATKLRRIRQQTLLLHDFHDLQIFVPSLGVMVK